VTREARSASIRATPNLSSYLLSVQAVGDKLFANSPSLSTARHLMALIPASLANSEKTLRRLVILVLLYCIPASQAMVLGQLTLHGGSSGFDIPIENNSGSNVTPRLVVTPGSMAVI
jgi:hypothetical protein